MSNESDLAVDAIQNTLTEFRTQCESWGQEFDTLLDELDSLPVPSAANSTELDQMIHTLSGHQHHVAQRQDDIGVQLTAMQRLVERQVEMLGALLEENQQLPTSREQKDSSSIALQTG